MSMETLIASHTYIPSRVIDDLFVCLVQIDASRQSWNEGFKKWKVEKSSFFLVVVEDGHISIRVCINQSTRLSPQDWFD